jgi:hypothetical protein
VRRDPLHPPVQGDVVDLDASFSQELLEVAVRRAEVELPAHSQQGDLRWEPQPNERLGRRDDRWAGMATLHRTSFAPAAAAPWMQQSRLGA